MSRFLSLLALFIKRGLKSTSFWVSAAVLLLLFSSFALLCPVARPASAQIGLMYDDDSAFQAACEPLLNSDTLRFVWYPPESLSAMQQDVCAGVLHCAYRISSETVPPITVYENEGAFLTPITDELVFAAWFETQLPQTTLTISQRLGLKDQQLILAEMQRLQVESIPLAPILTLNTAASPQTKGVMSLTPLLYAVLIPLFLLCCAFSVLLAPGRAHELAALLRMRCPDRPHLPAAAAALAQILLFASLPALCEILMLLLNLDTGYSLVARLVLIGLLAFLAAVLVPMISRLRSNAALLLALVLWAAVSVVFSGAIITPDVFGSFSALKYISPSWHLLRLMTALS